MMTFLADIIAIFESPTKKEGLFAIIMLPGQFLGTSSSDWTIKSMQDLNFISGIQIANYLVNLLCVILELSIINSKDQQFKHIK